MTVGIFQSHDPGMALLLGAQDWPNDTYYAMLIKTAQVVNRAGATRADIIANVCADVGYVHIDLTGKTLAVAGTNIRFDCAKINFGDTVSISGRFLYILKGTVALSSDSDVVIGCIDLQTETGDVSSVSAKFSYDPAATGLFEIERTA